MQDYLINHTYHKCGLVATRNLELPPKADTTDFVLRVEGLGRKVDSFTEEQVDLNIL